MSPELARLLQARLHAAADEANDAADHDELHAAAALMTAVVVNEAWLVDPAGEHYVRRWLAGLVARVGPVEPFPADPGAPVPTEPAEPSEGHTAAAESCELCRISAEIAADVLRLTGRDPHCHCDTGQGCPRHGQPGTPWRAGVKYTYSDDYLPPESWQPGTT